MIENNSRPNPGVSLPKNNNKTSFFAGRRKKAVINGAKVNYENTLSSYSQQCKHSLHWAMCKESEKHVLGALGGENIDDVKAATVALREWALLKSEEFTGDVGNALEALASKADDYEEFLDETPGALTEGSEQKKVNLGLRHAVRECWEIMLDLIQPAMPAEEYHPAFSVVNEVGISIENQHGTLVDEALALLRDTAAIECDTRQSGWRWTPSELEHWKKALACLDNVKTYQNSYGRAVQTSWSMGGWERMPAKDVKWGERISVGKVQEFKPRPKAPTGQERRDEVKAKQVLRSPRRQKDRPELAEQVKKAQERSREKHVGKQMRIAWMALGEMIEGKKEQLRCDSSD